MENTSDSFMPGPLLFCMKIERSVCYKVTDNILVIDDQDQPLTMVDARLEEAIIQTKARLVVLDPIQSFLGAGVDMHRANEIRPIDEKNLCISRKISMCHYSDRSYE